MIVITTTAHRRRHPGSALRWTTAGLRGGTVTATDAQVADIGVHRRGCCGWSSVVLLDWAV